MQCFTFDLEGDPLALLLLLLLLVYKQMKTDIHTLTYLEKNEGFFFFDAHFKGLVSLIYWVKAWVGPQ